MTKVAVVTGGNKGIGFAIVRGLCKNFQGDVYLTSRDAGRGQQAVDDLKKEGLDPKFHQLDVLKMESIKQLATFLKEKYGGVDVLVNNAGMAYKGADPTPFPTQAVETMKTNYTAILNVCDAIFPILKTGARVVHISSTVSTMFLQRSSQEKRQKLQETNSIQEVTALMDEFVKDAKEGKHKEKGWADTAYGATKIGVTAITPIQQANIDKDKPKQDILINSCCPGYVKTDMSGQKGGITPDQGAITPLYLALLPPQDKMSPEEKKIRGCFLSKKKVYKWKEGEYSSF